MRTLQTPHDADSPYAWTRLWIALALMTIGGSGMYSMAVVLPPLQAEFGIARADASLPYTLTMIGFGFGGILMGKLADRFGPAHEQRQQPALEALLQAPHARSLHFDRADHHR